MNSQCEIFNHHLFHNQATNLDYNGSIFLSTPGIDQRIEFLAVSSCLDTYIEDAITSSGQGKTVSDRQMGQIHEIRTLHRSKSMNLNNFMIKLCPRLK